LLNIDTTLFEEIVTVDEFQLLNAGCKGYFGVEPSGKPHIGTILVTGLRIRKLMEAGVRMKILLADWHAMVNDKFGGNLNDIRTSGDILKKAYEITLKGLSPEFIWATDMIHKPTYMEGMIKSAKSTTLSRLKRALPIMGRTEEDAESDFSKYMYPLMQVNDIFELDVDVALGGMDQRHAHMLARDIAEKTHRKKVVSFHSPILGSLKGSGRMDNFQKMSKSDPGSAILMSDTPEEVGEKIKNAFCPMGESKGNPLMDIMRIVVFPEFEDVKIERPVKKGGDISFKHFSDLEKMYVNREIHPLDLKAATERYLMRLIKPYQQIFDS
jgi:Tyrosyl-tRNA synthetase